ncbi:aminoacyl-tRNA deacylase and HDOD domain-containing protein [Teredinibacter waterburyi]|uniref:aminoacyl-tRNA deacylase and HDOD domain-containing protein n=1 Tax=Teredinibacter waterburyi TaxID=1500538 RepID=UPI001FE5D35C|nr:HDOD domain-containing protein [Teredinibacter waterburyi]
MPFRKLTGEKDVSLPASIVAMLNTQNIHFEIPTTEATTTNMTLVPSGNRVCAVRSMLVQDSQGKVQLLFPADAMVDLDALLRQTGRSLEGLPIGDINQIMDTEGLTAIPAIPGWQGLPTIIDDSLMKKDIVWLESGAGRYLELNQTDFANIVAKSERKQFAVSLPNLTDDTAKDEAQILDSVKRFTQKRIQQRLDETLELPPLPETAQRIIRLRADPEADISDLANIVELDPSLAAQVVSWAASPYYSAPGKIKSVHDAIVRVLGFDMVLNLALGLSMSRSMTNAVLSKKQIADYWRGAAYTAAVVEGLVTSIPREHRPSFGMAYLSGLLNNFGYMVMAEVFPPYFNTINRMSNANPHVPTSLVEHHLLGVTGNQIGAWLLDNWNMPSEVVTALRQQNNPHYHGEHCKYSKLLFIAQNLLAKAGFGDNLGIDLPESIYADLHLDMETASIAVENILESGEDLDALAEKMRG